MFIYAVIVLTCWAFVGLPTPAGDGWLLVDYSQRLITIALLAAVADFRPVVNSANPFRRSRGDLTVAIGLAAVTILVFKTVYLWAWPFFPFPSRPIPPIGSTVLWALDNSFGLMLVAWSEELLYTAVFLHLTKRWPTALAVFSGALLFAVAHFGRGGALMLAAFLAHIPFLVVYRRCPAFTPVFWGHYMADLVLLA